MGCKTILFRILKVLMFSCTAMFLLSILTGCNPPDSGSNTSPATVATPAFSLATGVYYVSQDVSITCATSDAYIYYTTNGSDPDETSTLYTGPVAVSSSITFKARAYKAGSNPSPVATGSYVISGTCAAPTFSVAGGLYNDEFDVSLATLTDGATIFFTTDGSDPATAGLVYTAPVHVDKSLSFRALARLTDWADSLESDITYTLQVQEPVFTPEAGLYATTQEIALTCATTAAVIYYTTDGSEPTTASPVYSSPITVPDLTATTVRAMAVKTGWLDSAVASHTYTVDSGPLTAELSTTASNPANAPFPLTVTFSAPVDPLTFSAGDILFTAGSGSISDPVTTDNIVWTATVMPDCQGIITLLINDSAVQDVIARSNTASEPLTLDYDSLKPEVTLSTAAQARTNLNPIPVTIVFSEAIDPATFQTGDIRVTNGLAGAPATLDNITWTTEIIPAGPEALLTVNIDAEAVTDTAGNTNNAGSALTRTYITTVGYDNSAKSNTTTIGSFTVGDNAHRILIVGVHLYRQTNGGLTVQSVSYGGTAMTLIPSASLINGSNGNRMITQLYYLNNPAVGSADVVVMQNGSTSREIFALSLYDTSVHTGSALGAVITKANATAPRTSLTSSLTTTTAHSCVVDIFGGDTVSATITAASGQTVRQNYTAISPVSGISTFQTYASGVTGMNYSGIAAQTYRINQVITEIKIAR